MIEHFTTKIKALSIWFFSLFPGCKNWPKTHGFTPFEHVSLKHAHKRSSQYNGRHNTCTSIFISTKTCFLKAVHTCIINKLLNYLLISAWPTSHFQWMKVTLCRVSSWFRSMCLRRFSSTGQTGEFHLIKLNRAQKVAPVSKPQQNFSCPDHL